MLSLEQVALALDRLGRFLRTPQQRASERVKNSLPTGKLVT